MVDTLVEHRPTCAPFTLQIFLLTHETQSKTNVTLHKKNVYFKFLTIY